MKQVRVGVLALQGDFEKHQQMLARLDVIPVLVKTAEQLRKCQGLIIPGGESTTLSLLLRKHGLWDQVKDYAREHPVFGTCAGLILLAATIEGAPVESLGLIDIHARRNAYGRQVNSFVDTIKVDFGNGAFDYEGVFIRAPKVIAMGQGVRPLAWHGEDVVMAEQGLVLAATFHPELTEDPRIHEYFVSKLTG
ncbi:MAG: pyridoxal 5'-phosphate synthase glutaminase subunit PdxT [candidate division KSB1 bacterium]|nr:pyridoxal 5'-phosphate synthase glutaminase subunit PdxT [candidate division KSB1 bacterium]MDZ7293900.1 pyridoxal 5'-phosphate synthase glutaminase subunit PdxT [candidate division KSB1 bacterium]MDZ7384700.1 pyridoxal 5'-phosphate synthase glutaminase subunit PdxT [candidate division KSB1 bacterium]MDZ7392269.1 pyridoxal 5'-phosphate synthase glutaminase subunit PdxT [candidate division KSB1 bacterium]MDZ7413066.1 pyridoxal 5'-phosphate synthase glutaminase subunit PdxT [candidate division